MNSDTKQVFLWSGVALVVVGALAFFAVTSDRESADAGEFDSVEQAEAFAQCLADEGAVYYGDFTCPACATQNRMFGNAEESLPYVECNTGQGFSAECQEANVQVTPTWDFEDGDNRLEGVLSIAELSEATGCSIDEQADTTDTEEDEEAGEGEEELENGAEE